MKDGLIEREEDIVQGNFRILFDRCHGDGIQFNRCQFNIVNLCSVLGISCESRLWLSEYGLLRKHRTPYFTPPGSRISYLGFGLGLVMPTLPSDKRLK